MSITPEPAAARDFERVLLVHAHPDDETIVTGATIATLVGSGAQVTVVTCTRGEMGEVIPDDLAALRDDPAALAAHRESEIAGAMGELGVSDHRFLGSAGARTAGRETRAYRDSGMEWGADGRAVPMADLHPAAFCAAEFGEVVSDLAAVVADVRPDAVISYDADGGYGHPDHVRTNRAALRVARLADVPFFAITAGTVVVGTEAHPDPVDVGSAHTVSAADVTIDGRPVLERKVRALHRYRSQVTVVDTPGGPALEFPHGAVVPVTVVETFRHVPEPRAADPVLGTTDIADFGLPGKVVAYVLALVVGGLFGAIGTVAHQDGAGSFPYGVVLALALVAAAMIGFRILFDSRMVGLVVAIGITVVDLTLSLTSRGGSVLIPGNLIGYAWIGGSILIAAFVLLWPKLPPRPPRSPGAPRSQPSVPGSGASDGRDRIGASLQTVPGPPDANGQNRP
jgi:N-acetyl-1-D-myo-inositol-2-amino-2-deoxy-alpha-D-glucopyranoside deacetylase